MGRGVGAGVAVLGLLLLAGSQQRMRTPVLPPGRGRGSVPPPAGGSTADTPTAYAEAHASAMRLRWAEWGSLAREYLPLAFGDAPPELAVGATAMSTGQHELTSANEAGYFNTPLAHWETLRTSPLVREMLGRDAVTAAQWRGAVPDQVAVGLADLRREQTVCSAALPEAMRVAIPGSGWGWWVAQSAWSAGAARAARHWREHEAAVTAAMSADRVTALVRSVLAAIEAGHYNGAPALSHDNAAYTTLRTCQKLWCARALAEDHGELDPWWSQVPRLTPGEEAQLVRGARGVGA